MRNLVVTGLDFESEHLEIVDDQASQRLRLIDRRQIEIATLVVRIQRRSALFVYLKEEELRFATGHHRVAKLGRLLNLPLQGETRTTREWRVVRVVDVADQASDTATLIVVGKNPKGCEIRLEEHVALFDAYETLDGRTVKEDVPGESLRELTLGNLHVLVDTSDIGELQSQGIHLEPLGKPEDVLSCGALGG